MQKFKLLIPATVIAISMMFGAIGTVSAQGSCGEYKYSQEDKCVDARDKTEKSWGDTMSSKAIW